MSRRPPLYTRSATLCPYTPLFRFPSPYLWRDVEGRASARNCPKAVRHLGQVEPKMVVSRDPERSVLSVREHRKREESPFAGRHGLNVDRPYSPRIRRRWWRIRRTMPISISTQPDRKSVRRGKRGQ